MKGQITHKGKVISVTPECIQVEIISESACASCHASALCGMSEAKKKIVETAYREGFEPGQEVTVAMKQSMGEKAVLIAYIGPLVVFVAVLMVLLGLGVDELICGLAGIGAGALYYFLVWLMRDKLAKSYTFEIK
ncbi:MAG: SoxR reducing system RseC family protein [Bacteroidales bacterium]|nr:SoxR reducing system RseC family protein [Bacteroidales bacterium]